MRLAPISILLFSIFFSGVSNATDSSLQKNIADHFQLYLVKDSQRGKFDEVKITGSETNGYVAELQYWRGLKGRDPAKEICNAYRWLFFGRTTYGQGAKEAFSRWPKLQAIRFHFVDVESKSSRGRKLGEILPQDKAISYLRIGVQRSKLQSAQPKWDQIRDLLDRGKCGEAGQNILDVRWFNKDYLLGKSS